MTWAFRISSFRSTVRLSLKKAIIIGNIRMGFGHYRISMAMASCAKALGYTPYWLDLAGFDATGSKMIRYQNDLYSTGSQDLPKIPSFQQGGLGTDEFGRLPQNHLQFRRSEKRGTLGSSFPRHPEGYPLYRHPRVAESSRRPCRAKSCRERHPRQLADGPSSFRRSHPHRPDSVRLSRIQDAERHGQKPAFGDARERSL
jgi:hypothetical protein